MAYTIYSSANFQFDFGAETSFNSGAGTDYGALGVAMKVGTFEPDNQYEALYQINQRNPVAFYSKGQKFNINTDFTMANDNVNWLNYILYNSATNTYTVGNVSSAYGTLVGGGKSYNASGVIFDGATINFEQGKPVEVTMDGVGTRLTMGTATVSPTIPSQFVTWTTVTVGGITQPIESLNLKIENAPERYYTLGSLDYVAYIPLKFSVTGTIKIYHDSDIIDTIMGSSTTQNPPTSPITLTITAGNYVFSIAGLYYNTGKINIVPVETVMDEITFVGENLTVTT